MEYKVVMPYVGGILSENAFKFATRGTFPIVKRWMRELADKVRELQVPESESYEIRLFGKFTDDRRPDLSNLHKVIGDALEKGLGTNDKNFLLVDVGVSLGHLDPELVITIVPNTSVQEMRKELEILVRSEEKNEEPVGEGR